MTNRQVILGSHVPRGAISGRWLLVALGTLILCSCRANTLSLNKDVTDPITAGQLSAVAPPTDTSPEGLQTPDAPLAQLVSGESDEPTIHAAVAVVEDNHLPAVSHGLDISSHLASCPVPPTWCPDRPVRRTPHDEYLCDGGDNQTRAKVNRQWEAYGVEAEDTLAHFDTLNGRIEVVASNRVCIYAPRFAAVRKISGFRMNERLVAPSRVQENLEPHGYDDTAIAGQVKQPESTVRGVGTSIAQGLQDRQGGRRIEQIDTPLGTQDRLTPIENLAIIRTGEFSMDESVVVDEAVQAAIAWTNNQAVQLIIDRKQAFRTKAATNGQVCYTYQMDGNPRMRVVKMASVGQAQPGEIVEFTIRFDNVGDEPVGNVTVLDNLTTRLEYVEGSQTCTCDAVFSSQPNDGESSKLMWDIEQPLETSEGGVIRFQCRVR